MKSYRVQVRLQSGATAWVTIEARSNYEAQQLGAAYGHVIMVILNTGL